MCAHPLFAGIGFEELKTIREDSSDGHKLMKKASNVFVDAMNKTAEVNSSPVGSATFDVSTGDSFYVNISVPPSSRL